jgi:hypothetical protein
MGDSKLIASAAGFLGVDEPITAAGVFQPRGTSGGMVGVTGAGLATDNIVGEVAGVTAGLAAGHAMSHVHDVPRWTMLAVTESTLYAIACDQHGVGWQPEESFATLDRSSIQVHVHGGVNVHVLEVVDPEGRTYEWEGFRFGPSHAKDVIHALLD